MSKKAVFFDRDNTLIIDKNYMFETKDLEFYEDSFSALKLIQSKGFELFIVTNQSGIGRGYFSIDQMHLFHKAMLDRFTQDDIEFRALKFCPHAPDDGCDCRKPNPTLILECIKEYDIDTKNSFMIGDKVIDAQCGENAGMTGVTLNSKKESKFKDFKSLTEFANYL